MDKATGELILNKFCQIMKDPDLGTYWQPHNGINIITNATAIPDVTDVFPMDNVIIALWAGPKGQEQLVIPWTEISFFGFPTLVEAKKERKRILPNLARK